MTLGRGALILLQGSGVMRLSERVEEIKVYDFGISQGAHT